MAYSVQQFTSTGAEDHIILSFPYLDKSDIHLYGNSVETAFVWVSDNRIDFPPFPSGTEVVVRRLTQRDKVRYLLQEGAPFTREILDQIHTQALYLAQEAAEGVFFDMYGDIDMHGFRVRNAGAPILPSDYTTRDWVEAAIQDVNSDYGLRADLALPTGASLVKTATGVSVQQALNSLQASAVVITPEMFYSGTGPHSAAVQAAFDRSASTGELVYLGGQYFFDVPVTVKNGVNVVSGQRASVSPAAGSGNGTAFDFDAGNSNRRFELPALSGFNVAGVPAVAVRCDLAVIYVRQFVGCHTSFKTIADAGNNSILDVILEFNTMSACEVAWEMHCGAASNVVQGCVLKGSFITDTTRVFKRTGVAAFDDGNIVDVYAVDFTTRCAGGAFLDNQVPGHAVPRMTAKVQSWFGGDAFNLTGANAVRVVAGQFSQGEMSLALATALNQDSVPANQWRSGEWRTMRTAATIGQSRVMPNTPVLASFNGGIPLSNTEFIVQLVLQSDLAAGAQAVGYFWNVFADGSYPRWQATPIEGNTRLMLASIKDQSSTEAGRVELAVRNIDSAPVIAGQSVYFRVSRR